MCTIVRSMTVFAEANVDVDLRMLRSFRVLRPLKLVSRIPSKGPRNVTLNPKKIILLFNIQKLDYIPDI